MDSEVLIALIVTDFVSFSVFVNKLFVFVFPELSSIFLFLWFIVSSKIELLCFGLNELFSLFIWLKIFVLSELNSNKLLTPLLSSFLLILVSSLFNAPNKLL